MRACVWYALVLFAGVPTLLSAQGFGIYEQGTCAMGRAGTGVAAPCSDGSAMFFNPAGLAGLTGAHATIRCSRSSGSSSSDTVIGFSPRR